MLQVFSAICHRRNFLSKYEPVFRGHPKPDQQLWDINGKKGNPPSTGHFLWALLCWSTFGLMEILIILCCPTPEVDMIINIYMSVYMQAPILLEIIMEIFLDPTRQINMVYPEKLWIEKTWYAMTWRQTEKGIILSWFLYWMWGEKKPWAKVHPWEFELEFGLGINSLGSLCHLYHRKSSRACWHHVCLVTYDMGGLDPSLR